MWPSIGYVFYCINCIFYCWQIIYMIFCYGVFYFNFSNCVEYFTVYLIVAVKINNMPNSIFLKFKFN